jgi:ketosteroid isomerase-like protein
VSRENVELAKRCIDAYNKRDIEAMRTLDAPDLELDYSASLGVEAGVYRGFDACLQLWASGYEAFDEIDIKPESYLDAGDSIVIPNTSRQLGREGIEVFARSTLVFTFSSGQLTRICLYQEKEQALKAVGLEG